MRAPFVLTLRQVLFPTGLAVMAGYVGLRFVPAAALGEHAVWIVACILTVAAMAAIRLHTLRAFMAISALAAATAGLQLTAGAVPRLVLAAAACDLVLVLLADDSYFDWQAVQWWAGLLLVQTTILTAAVRWSPEFAAGLEAQTLGGAGLQISALSIWFCLCGAALLLRFYFLPDPISAALVWASAALGVGTGSSAVGLAGVALAVGILERTHWIAYHDELTGLPGRRAFHEALAALGERYCIAVVDVDHFKQFNDTFGHDTGDQVLRKVASSLAEAHGGTAYRCGGEEFAIVYPAAEIENALASAEAVRQQVEAESFMVRGPARSTRKRPERRTTSRPGRLTSPVEVSVTVSIGLAAGNAGADPGDVVKQADKALYSAKAGGRNRVTVYEPQRRRKAMVTAAS